MKWGAIMTLTAMVAAMSTHVRAESAWILWHDLREVLHGDIGQREWTEAGTAKTIEECVALRASTIEDHLKRLQSEQPATGISRLRGDSTIMTTTKYGWIEIRYSCWPENEDPRR